MNAHIRKLLSQVVHIDDRVLIAVLFSLFFIKSRFTIDPDFGWHISSGEYMLTHGVPQTDIYTYTAVNFPWIHHEWLADIINYLVYHVGGYTLLAAVHALMWTAAFYLVARPYSAKLYMLLAALVALPYAGVRAVTWTMLMLTLLVIVLRQVQPKRWLWVLPVMLLWANVHGSFVVGLLYICFHAIRHRSWYTAGLLIVSLLLTLCNPYSIDVYTEVLRTVSDSSLHTRIGEWKSFQLEVGLGMIVGAWAAARLLADWRKPWRAVPHPDAVVLLLALSASRHIPVFALASLPVILKGVQRMPSLTNVLADARIATMGLVAVVIVALTLGYDGLRTVRLDPEVAYPRQMAGVLREYACKGNLFNDYNDGGYLIWRAPTHKVFIDGRMPSWHMGDTDYFAMYERILKDKDYQKQQFDHYNVTCVLAGKDGNFARHLRTEGWRDYASADGYVLLERDR
jgi:hypothetical protein